ncbi:MAG: hypothetical protein ACI86C_001704, partial [Candidatus Latescibacterota bacterium]
MKNELNKVRFEFKMHNNQKRIFVFFPYNKETVQQCKKIPGARWSASHMAWHFPTGEEVKSHLQDLFPELGVQHIQKIKPIVVPDYQNKGQVVLEIFSRKILIRMARNEGDIAFVKSIRFARWDAKYGFWQVSNYGTNLYQLQTYFGKRIISTKIHQSKEDPRQSENSSFQKGHCKLVKIRKMLNVMLEFNPKVSSFIKEIPLSYWDAENKWWVVPYR